MPERHRAERAVRRRVAVAARDRHPGLRESEVGTDHVDDSLPVIVQASHLHAEVTAVALERRDHVFGEHVQERALPLARRDDVIDRRERAIGARHFPPADAQRIERLRRGDFVNEVKADEQLSLAGRQLRTVWRSHTFWRSVFPIASVQDHLIVASCTGRAGVTATSPDRATAESPASIRDGCARGRVVVFEGRLFDVSGD
jgi:hypothetical protein